jgi:hypothetical protein
MGDEPWLHEIMSNAMLNAGIMSRPWWIAQPLDGAFAVHPSEVLLMPTR